MDLMGGSTNHGTFPAGRRRLSTLLCLCITPLSLFALSCMRNSEAAPGKQPITYNHKIHVQDNEMECVDCHRYAKTGAWATIPNIEVCRDCHLDEPSTESGEEQKVIDYISRGEKIPWKKVYRVPSHVYFSHRRHTAMGRIDCGVCHGNVEELTVPPDMQRISISMGACMECHDRNQVDNDCVRCHR